MVTGTGNNIIIFVVYSSRLKCTVFHEEVAAIKRPRHEKVIDGRTVESTKFTFKCLDFGLMITTIDKD